MVVMVVSYCGVVSYGGDDSVIWWWWLCYMAVMVVRQYTVYRQVMSYVRRRSVMIISSGASAWGHQVLALPCQVKDWANYHGNYMVTSYRWSPSQVFSGLLKTWKQAGAELGQAQQKLEMKLSFTWFMFCCIKLIDKNNTGYFDCHYEVPTTKVK